jgi:predicted aspartyl protease
MVAKSVLLWNLTVLSVVVLPVLGPPKKKDNLDRLYSVVRNREYNVLESSIFDSQLSADDAALFRGILANRKNRLRDSIQLLAPMAPVLATAPPSWREQELMTTLGDDYSKVFEYGKAEAMFAALLKRYGRSLSGHERRTINERMREMQLLRAAPPQTVEQGHSETLPSTFNPLGLLEVPVEINGKTESWLLDTGANTCVITETTARRIGLQLLDGTATTEDISGLPVTFRIGVVPQLKIGSSIFHNVELPVTNDKNLNFGGYQIQGIIGFPIQSALGIITIYADGRVGIRTEPTPSSASDLFMEGQSPVVAAQVTGTVRLFTLDTGATGSNLSQRLYQAIKSQTGWQKNADEVMKGAGGSHSIRSRRIGRLLIAVGGQQVQLTDVAVFTEPTHSALDDFFGNLGQDLLHSFKSYTIDFDNMKFSARN